MPLAAGRELLGAVERGGYAVPGLNVSNLEVALGAAEARRAYTQVFRFSRLSRLIEWNEYLLELSLKDWKKTPR